jgi:large subunit ribosomal protein L32
MRHSSSQKRSTRSHHALKGLALTKCPDCNLAVIRHQACSNCGKYKGKVVINLEAKSVKAKGKSAKKVETK